VNKTKIDWTDMSWNPVTGCLKNCRYCYAKGIAHRFGTPENAIGEPHELDVPILRRKDSNVYPEEFEYQANPYPYGFDPTFHKYRLVHPTLTKVPQRIFTGSMADLFGEWVPDEWIAQVYDACNKAPEHTYLFLTKNPKRYAQLLCQGRLPYSDNYWYGVTVTDQKSLNKALDIFALSPHGRNTFMSIEPLHEYLKLGMMADWVIVGAETSNGKVVEERAPDRLWIESIVEDCRAAGVPLFMKRNLEEIWKEPLIQEFPTNMMKG